MKKLTDEQIGEIAAMHYAKWRGNEPFARAIETESHRINNLTGEVQPAADDKAGGEATYIDRADAVNLARNILESDSDDITQKGVRMLCDAVLRMDAAILSGSGNDDAIIVTGMIEDRSGVLHCCINTEFKPLTKLYARPQPQADSLQEIAAFIGIGGFNGASTEQLVARIKDEFRRLTPAKPQADVVSIASEMQISIANGDLPDQCEAAADYLVKTFGAGTKPQAERPADHTEHHLEMVERPAEMLADMFWNSDDAERQHYSIAEFLSDEICNGSLEVGAEFTIWQAKKLPSIKIIVTNIDDESCDAEYKVIDGKDQS